MPHETIDEYIADQPDAVRPTLKRLRTVIKQSVKGAEELISYAIPAFRLSGRVGLFFAGWKDHVSIYPVSDAVVAELGAELNPYIVSKTLRFPLSKTLPVHLIQKVAKARAKELSALPSLKKKAAPKKKPVAAKKRSTKR